MDNYEIKCINKPHHSSPHEHITHVGGEGWHRTSEDIIKLINDKRANFYVRDPYSQAVVWVAVVTQTGKRSYLRTHADGKWTDNLLSLNECSIR